AFNSFCQAVEQGRFPQLLDRDGLWRLLVAITERKAIDLVRRQRREKRGAGRILTESKLGRALTATGHGLAGLAGLPGREPTPEFAASVAEECERLLKLLGDDTLRRLALLKLEGYSNGEIARQLGCALRGRAQAGADPRAVEAGDWPMSDPARPGRAQ